MLAVTAFAAAAGTLAAATPTTVAAPTTTTTEMVTLEVVADQVGDLAAATAVVLAHGGTILGEASGVLLVSVPAGTRSRLTAVVGAAVREPVPVDVRPESLPVAQRTPQFGPTTGTQVAITNADAWHTAGITGNGIKVGVIDYFDNFDIKKLWNTSEHGPAPVAGATAKCFDNGADCTATFFEVPSDGGDNHGLAVVETIRDMAPDVEIYIGQATTISDYRLLIDWFAGKGVTIVNRSLGSHYDGPGDGRGPLDDLVTEAVSKGIFWVNSGGNNGIDKYYRQPVRIVNDRVAFGPSGSDTYLQFKGCITLGGIRWANDWDKPASARTDYDAYLWESPTGKPAAGSIVDSSIYRQRSGARPIEQLPEYRCPTEGNSLYLELRWRGGDTAGDVIEILDYGEGMTMHTQSGYSAAVPVVDAKPAGVISVGAIDPAASGTIAEYSSRGPTNDRRVAPGLVAPSNLANSVRGRFAGTSAAAAVVTGGATLLLDATLAVDPTSLGNLVRHLTIDRGPAGPDNLYGFGEFRLPDPPPADGIDTTPSRFVSVETPTRLLDTRPATRVGPSQLIGRLVPGEILDLPVAGVSDVPAQGATAVAVNIVAVQPDGSGYLQALPTLRAGIGSYSNLNTDGPGQIRANFAIVPIGDNGRVSIYSSAGGDVVVDLLGWFEGVVDPPSAGRFVELPSAQRLLDSRDAPANPLDSGDVIMVPMPTGVSASLVDSLVVTVTATQASASGWLQALPADLLETVGRTSTVNVPAGSTVATTAIVAAGAAGFAITGNFGTGGSVHVVVDAIGYITSARATGSSGLFVAVQPNRAFDSRLANRPLVDRQTVLLDASQAPGVSVPANASGVVWNLAIVNATRPGYLRGWAPAGKEPVTSALNWTLPGETRAAAVVTAVDNGSAIFRIEDGGAYLPTPVGHLIADVFGYFT